MIETVICRPKPPMPVGVVITVVEVDMGIIFHGVDFDQVVGVG